MSDMYDLAVIGGGPAGYTAALEAAKYGMRTALVEERELGGTCLNRGCIPTKTILHSAELYAGMRNAERFGVSAGGPSFDMPRVIRRKTEVVDQLRGGIETLVRKNKIDVISGRGAVAGPNRVVVNGDREIFAERILIAAGSVPAAPPIPGAELPGVVTSDQLLDMEELFDSLIIVGGGVIGMEFASIYNAFGKPVTVIEFMDSILPNMDREISRNLKMILAKRGVEFHTGARVESIEPGEGGLICRFTEKDAPREARAQGILIATGRRANTGGLFTGGFCPETDRGRILADGCGRTDLEGIYAAGDVTGGTMLAHAASAQAVNAVRHMAGEPPLFDLRYVPGCVYTDPEIGTVGITQDEAKRRGLEVTVKKYPMSANGKTVLSDLDRGFIKVVADRATGRILGAQMMCARATDMISQFTAAITNGLALDGLAGVIYPHPTFSEAIGETVRG